MNENEEKEIHETAYEKRHLPKSIVIKGNELSYKDPPFKNNIFKYRCRKNKCKYFVKINEEIIKMILNNENIIIYEEFNKHSYHKNNNISMDQVFTDKQIEKLANDLKKANINEPLNFHISNFERNKINWKKIKIRKLFYSIREEKFPKDESFVNDIESININMRENDENFKSNFCLSKGEFININKMKKIRKIYHI